MLRDCEWPGCDRPEGPAAAGFCATHYSADRRQGEAPPMSRWEEFLWLTDTMRIGWGEAARRLGYTSWSTLAAHAYAEGRPDLRGLFQKLHQEGQRP